MNIEKYQTAADEAARQLEAMRLEIHEEATTLTASLAEQTSESKERDSLVNIIDQALGRATKLTRSTVPIIIQQFVTGRVAHPDVLAGNGSMLLDVFLDGAQGLSDGDKFRALEACLLAASERADGGLFSFSKPWGASLTLPTLRAFAEILDADSYSKHTGGLAEQRAAYQDAKRTAELFSTPVTINPTAVKAEPGTEPERVHIKHTPPFGAGPLPLQVAHVAFAHGDVTNLTPEQFDAVQQSPLWASYQQSGELEVVTGDLPLADMRTVSPTPGGRH